MGAVILPDFIQRLDFLPSKRSKKKSNGEICIANLHKVQADNALSALLSDYKCMM